MDDQNLDSLSKRLKYLMELAGIKQVHLASKLGVTAQAINHLCKSDTKFSKHTKEIAKILKANEGWLASGIGPPFLETPDTEKTIALRKIPLYFLEQFKKITTPYNINQINPVEHHWSSSLSEHAFGFYISNNNLAPRFETGDLVLLEPKTEISNGALGLMYSHERKELLFCHLYINRNKNLLCGFIPQKDFGIFIINDDDIIYGVYHEAIKKA